MICRLYPLFLIACSLAGGGLAHHWGKSTIEGVLAGFMAAWLPLLLLGLAAGFMMLWCPDQPPCPTGRCRSKDYRFIEMVQPDAKDPKSWSYIYSCKCGRRCVAHKNTFSELHEDGTTTPYMVISKWGRWTPVENANLHS